MKKLIYILLGLFTLVSCIDDQSDLGGDAISLLSFVNHWIVFMSGKRCWFLR